MIAKLLNINVIYFFGYIHTNLLIWDSFIFFFRKKDGWYDNIKSWKGKQAYCISIRHRKNKFVFKNTRSETICPQWFSSPYCKDQGNL